MLIGSEFAQIYSRNKNIYFEPTRKMRRFFRIIGRLSNIFLKNKMFSFKPVFSERIVEYPLIFHLLKQDYKYILDFGCVEDLLPIHLASLGFKVTGLDFRPYPFSHPNFEYIQADIVKWRPPNKKFDCVISVSTVEHVGLGVYGDPVYLDGDKIAVKKLFSCVKPGGDLIITVPFGKPVIKGYMRIYDYKKLHQLIPNIYHERFFAKNGRYGMWEGVAWQKAEKIKYDTYTNVSPCEAVAYVIARND